MSFFEEYRAISDGMMKAAVVAGPMLAKKNPRLDGPSCNTFKPTMGINAGITEINRENRTVRAKTICSPGA
jgi:hypothetical protein